MRGADPMTLFNIALKISRSIDAKNQLRSCAENLSEVYEDMGNTKEALRYFKEATAINDSMFSQESADQILELNSKYESEKKEEWKSEDGKVFYKGLNEKEMLESFWRVVKVVDQFISFNGRNFDVPF